jgi:cystathionine beta-lyase family protein involved in aluminum resistance
MNDAITSYIKTTFGIDKRIGDLAAQCERKLAEAFKAPEEICAYNQYKVLSAFIRNGVSSDLHFPWKTGYGYDDPGRDVTEAVFADTFGCEAALVRTQIVNGTHAINIAFSGILRPGDEMIYCTGAPYDSLQNGIGVTGSGMGSLKEFGITYKQVELDADGAIDLPALKSAITPATRMVCCQRATGYSDRKAVTIDEIEKWASFVKSIRSDIICMVDNCYGEFLETKEPTEVGADIMASSLIKQAGGGLALSGGYVAGRADLVEKISYRMTCPGIGGECGLTFGQTRNMLQGFFLAPNVAKSAIKGAMFCALLFEKLGFYVKPKWNDVRSDIVETVRLGSREALIAFCKGIQSASPVDAFASPVPGDMPGYEDQVIMASGAFVQGSTIELSADGPLREPYNVYFQGGLTYEHSKLGAMNAAQKLLEQGLITIR